MSSQFLSELLDDYGRPLDLYVGIGHLANDAESAAVEWAAAHYDDGQVLLACQGDQSMFGIFMQGATNFSGTSADGTMFDSMVRWENCHSFARHRKAKKVDGLCTLPACCMLTSTPRDRRGWSVTS